MDWRAGSNRIPAQLGRSGAFVKEEYADEHDLRVGSRFELRTPTGEVLALRVTGVFDGAQGRLALRRDRDLEHARFDRAFANRDNEFTFVNMRGGATAANTAALERAVGDFPEAKVETRDQFRDRQLEHARHGAERPLRAARACR